jgi:hypothetical protein
MAGVQDRMSVSASVGLAVGTQTFVFSYDQWPRIFGIQVSFAVQCVIHG